MGETANAALFAIVYAKGLVGRERLQGALDKATLEGIPLENILVNGGIISRPQCEELLRVRNRLGRVCAACGGTTFLLQDETEATAACEFCGGRLLPPRAPPGGTGKFDRGAVATPAPPQSLGDGGLRPQAFGDGGLRPQAPTPPQAPSTRRNSTASGRLERLNQASAGNPPSSMSVPPLPQGAPASAEQLADRITQHVLATVEARLAQEDLVGFLNTVVQRSTQASLEALAARMDGVVQMATKRLMPEIDARLEMAKASLLQEVLQQVEGRLPRGELPDPAKIQAAAEKAAERGARKAVEEAVAGLKKKSTEGPDPAALAGRITEQVLEQVQDHLARVDVNGLKERVERLAASVRSIADASSASGTTADMSAVEEMLGKRIADLEAKLKKPSRGGQLDADEVKEIAQRQARMAVKELMPAAGAAASTPAAAPDPAATRAAAEQAANGVKEALTRDLDALRERLDLEVQVMEDRLTSLASAGSSAPAAGPVEIPADVIKQIKDDVLQAVFVHDSPPTSGSDAGKIDPLQLGAQVFDAVREQIESRIEFMAEQATGPVLKSIQKKVDELGLKTLGSRIKAEVLEAVQSSATGQVDRGGAPSAGRAAGPAADAAGTVEAVQKKVMSAVDTRLAEFDMAVESAIQETTSKAMEAVEKRLSQLEEQSSERSPLGALPASSGPAPAEVIEQAREAATAAAYDVAEQTREAALAAAAEQAREAALAAVAEKVEALEEKLRSLPAAAPAGVSALPIQEPERERTGVYDKKFIALAREVKQLKESLERGEVKPPVATPANATIGGGFGEPDKPVQGEKQMRAFLDSEDFKALLESRIEARVRQLGGTSVGTTSAAPSADAGGGPSLVAMLGSTEFKQMFDAKINEVLKYLRTDLIPSTVKKTLREVEQKS